LGVDPLAGREYSHGFRVSLGLIHARPCPRRAPVTRLSPRLVFGPIPDESISRFNRPAVQPPQTAIQPLISTIPCKPLNIIANLMLKSFMFASQPNSASNRPRRLHPLHSTPCHPGSTPCHPHSNPCHPACPACPERSRGERSRRERSEGSAFLSLVAPRHSPLALAPVTPFLVYPELRRVYPEPRRATLALDSQLTENPATLSPFPATLTSRVNPNPFVCHSYKKHPGVGVSRQIFPLSCSSIFSVNSALSVPSALNSLPPICIASTVANSRRIRTYVKHTRNPFRIRTSKNTGLKTI
jgi:hypothetical protein